MLNFKHINEIAKSMKKFYLLFLFLPLFNQAQTIVTLALSQPPELGFEIGVQDVTITEGESVSLANDLIVSGGSGEYDFSWTPGTSLNDSTIMNPVATPVDTTNYILTVSDAYGCSFSVNYIVNVKAISTSVPSVSRPYSGLMVMLYPNPNNGIFKMKLSGEPQDLIQMDVIDISGRMMQKQTIKNFNGEHTEELKMNLPNGMYTLRITSEFNQLQRQFVIQ